MKKFFSFLFLILAGRLLAVTPVPYTEGVSFSFRIAGVGNGIMSVYDEAGTPSVGQTTSNATTESPLATGWLRPGKKYSVNFQASGPTAFWLSYIAPAGYALLINDVPQSITYQATAGGWYSYDYTLELRPIANYQSDLLGNFSGIDLGKSISWDIGLGTTRTGRSAGRIMFKEKDLSNSPSSRGRLYYAAPGNYGEISTNKDGASAQTLRQVCVPQGMVDIVDEASGYSFKFYTPAQIEWSPGNPAIMHGSPWKTIQVLFSGTVLTVTETEGTAVRVSELTATGDSVNYSWTLKEGTAATKIRTTYNTSLKTGASRDVISEVHTGSSVAGTLVSKTKFHYDDFAWNEELTALIADPDSAQLTTSYYYYATAPTSGDSNRGNYRQIRSVTAPTGNWSGYLRYDDWDKRGQMNYEFYPYGDLPVAPTTNTTALNTAAGRVVYYQYNSADWTGRYTRPTLREERINNTLTGQTSWTQGNIVGVGWPRETSALNSYRDGTNYQTDYTETFRGDSGFDDAYRPYLSNGANLTQTSFSGLPLYTTNQYRELVLHGSTSGTGAVQVSTWNSQSFAPTYLLPNKSTMDVTLRDIAGKTVRTESYVFTGGSSFSLLNSQDFTYDSAGRVTQSVANNGATVSNTYTNGRLTSVIDAAGTETQFTYDELSRVLTSTKMGVAATGSYSAQGAITTTNTYDGASHVTQATSAGGTLSLTTTSSYDLAGRLYSSTAPGGYTTGFVYSSGGKIVTTNLPGGTATKVTEIYLDGQPKSVSGTAVIAENYGYGIDTATGRRLRQTIRAGNVSAWTNVYWDWLGHQTEEWTSGWTANVVRTWYYNNNGQLFKFSQPGLADTLYTYDSLGNLFQEGLDINANGTLDLASADRITQKNWGIVSFDSGATWFRQTYAVVYATSGVGSGTIQSQDYERLNGFGTNLQSEHYHYDIYANGTYSATSVDRTNKKITTTTDTPDSSTNATQVAYNGLLMESTDTVGVKMQYGYDALGRQVTSTDPRTLTSTTAYKTGSSQVDWVKDPAGFTQATYTYDTAGRVSTVTDALGKIARYGYNDRNQKVHEWGDTTNPVEYVYDTFGRQTELHTYRAGTGWTGGTWPTATAGTADVTTWAFQVATGLLLSKTDASAHAVSFTYTQAGQVNTKTNARSQVTTNTYSSTTGELTNVAYSDGTPALAYTYTRLGQQSTVSDFIGTRTFNYNLGGTLELQSEDLPAFFSSRRLTYEYDLTGTGTKGRLTTMGLGTSTSHYSQQYQDFAYQADGRLTYSGAYAATYAGVGFNYSYQVNSHLISQIDQWTSNYHDSRVYNLSHDWLASRSTAIVATTKASFAYGQDAMGRIIQSSKTGELFNIYGNGAEGLLVNYGYDDRSELTSEQTKVGLTATTLTGRDNAHLYDPIGNRTTVTHNSNAATYTANSLNQYTQRTVPGIFDVAGKAAVAATVTVNGSATGVSRSGQSFFKGQALSNSPNPVSTSLTVSDGTTSTPVPAFVAGTPETFSYDLDGNLLSDGRWNYSYNAANQLTWMNTSAAAVGAGIPKVALGFYYDYLGRRVCKLNYAWSGSAWTFIAQQNYIYNAWNLIAELDGSMNITKNFFWGLDLSGTAQGAGGVGGLLMTQSGGNSYLPMYDGNGNVHGMITASDGSIAAAYEYDAFGNTLRESGTYAASNPFRYSTKYTDIETGLVYYGKRYYSPSLGRFINKDPIEEAGGLNLYGFCGNNGVNKWDYLGHDSEDGWTMYQGEKWTIGDVFYGDPEQSWISMGSMSGGGWADPTNHMVHYIRDRSTAWEQREGGDSDGNPMLGFMSGNGDSIAFEDSNQALNQLNSQIDGMVAQNTQVWNAIDQADANARLARNSGSLNAISNAINSQKQAGPSSAATAALFITNGGTVVVPYPPDPTVTYAGNRINFSAVVTGVRASDIDIRNNFAGSGRTIYNSPTDSPVVSKLPGDIDGVIYNGSRFIGGYGFTPAGTPPIGVTLEPAFTLNPSGNSVIFQFYDGPGQALDPNLINGSRTVNQTITTTISQISTGKVLTQQTWNTSSTLHSNGSGSTTFRR